MPPNSKSNLGESFKKSKLNLKITQDDQRLTIDLVDRTANQGRMLEPLSDSILIEPSFPVESVGSVTIKPKKKFSKISCLNMFEKRGAPKPQSDGYKHLRDIINQANESWSHFFLPLIHFGNIDPNREKVNKLMENFKLQRNSFSTQTATRTEKVQSRASQISNSDSHDIRLLSSFEEKNSSSSSASHSVRSKFNKLDALKTEIDKTINEINTFKNEVLHNESVKSVQTTEVGINTEISMSNAVFKIKYEDEEDEEELTKNAAPKYTDQTNCSKMNMPFIESPSDSNSYNKVKRNDLPALTLIKSLNKKYNLNLINDSDLSSTSTSRKNSSIQPKISHLESDSFDDYNLKYNKNFGLDDNNIFKKIFSRNLEKDEHRPSYINLEPIRQKMDSSSGLSSSNSEVYEPKRASKTFRKRDSWLNEERKRHSLKKLPVYDFGPSASKRNSSECKLKVIPLKKSVEQTKFHCCCCKCSCKDIPVYKTITTTTTTKIPISSCLAESSTDESAKSSDKSTTKSQNLYYFKSFKNQQKKNEFGLLSQMTNHDVDKKKHGYKYFMLDSLEERQNVDVDDAFDIYKNFISDTESTSDEGFDRIQSNIQYILDSLHRPHSAFQYNQDRTYYQTNLNELDFKTCKNQQSQMVIFYFFFNLKFTN